MLRGEQRTRAQIVSRQRAREGGTLDTEVEAVDTLAPFREQVRQEQEEKSERSKMSDAALAKLRAIKEQERVDTIFDERFATALRSVVVTPENLQTLLSVPKPAQKRLSTFSVRGTRTDPRRHHCQTQRILTARQSRAAVSASIKASQL